MNGNTQKVAPGGCPLEAGVRERSASCSGHHYLPWSTGWSEVPWGLGEAVDTVDELS